MASSVVVPQITVPVATVPAPPQKLPGYTNREINASWMEQAAHNGTQYYYSPLSNEGAYTRPDSFTATPNSILSPAAAGSNKTFSAVWKEYIDILSGKTYYSNGLTTQWTRPEEMSGFPGSADAAPKEERFDDAVPIKKRKRDEEQVQYESKEEATMGFTEFLVSNNVGTNLKWSEVSKMFSGDDRWEAIGKHLSTGERRQALAEYQTKRQNELKNQERQERQKAKDNFTRMLAEVLPTMTAFSAWSSKWSDVRQVLSPDNRFKSIEDESSRETLFVEFCEDFRKREGRRRRALKREAEVAYVSFLKDRRKTGQLSLSTTYHGFQGCLSDVEWKDKKLNFLELLEESEQQRLFLDFISEVSAAEEESKRRSVEKQRSEVKELRATFRDALVRLAEQSKLTPSSLWRDSQTALNESRVYSTLLERDPGAAREIFQMFMDGWNDAYLKNRSVLSQLVSYLPEKASSVTSETTYDDFVRALSNVSSCSQELAREVERILNEKPISSAKVYFDELKIRRASIRREGEESSDEGEIFEDD
jgi:pre-mRNA-processing factor 40